MSHPRTGLAAIGFTFLLFIIALAPLFWHDRWQRIHTVDFLQNLAAGALLGIVISRIAAQVRRPASA